MTTITTLELARGIATGETPTPTDERVVAIANHLNSLADSHHFDPQELQGNQPAILQDAYLADPVPEVLDHEGDPS